MKRNIILALLLVLGLVMLVWGTRFYATPLPIKTPTADLDEGGGLLSCDVVRDPTTIEILVNFVTGPIGQRLGALLVACLGFTMASGAALFFGSKKQPAGP